MLSIQNRINKGGYMKPFAKRSLEVVGGLALSGFYATQAFAQTTVTVPTNTGFDTSDHILATIFRVITIVGVILFTLLLLVGGIQYLGSFGNEESTKTARKLILDAVVGLFIVLAAGGIATFVLKQFGVNGVEGGNSGTTSNVQ